jgi:hypothetical protein
LSDGRDVTVKLIDPASEPVLPRRFDRHRKALTRLSERGVGILPVLEHGIAADGRPYLVIPHLPLGSLQDQLERGQTPWFPAARLMARVAEIVGRAHDEAVVLGDLRPSRILLETPESPVVSAFGMATRRFDDGRPSFRSPEARNDVPATPAADVYSLSLVFGALIAGEPKATDEPIDAFLGRVGALVPDRILDVLEHGLAQSHTNRYRSASAMHRALGRAIEVEPADDRWSAPSPVSGPSPQPEPDTGLPPGLDDLVLAPRALDHGEPGPDDLEDERLLLPPGLDDLVLAPSTSRLGGSGRRGGDGGDHDGPAATDPGGDVVDRPQPVSAGGPDDRDGDEDQEIVDLTELFTRTTEFVHDPDALGRHHDDAGGDGGRTGGDGADDPDTDRAAGIDDTDEGWERGGGPGDPADRSTGRPSGPERSRERPATPSDHTPSDRTASDHTPSDRTASPRTAMLLREAGSALSPVSTGLTAEADTEIAPGEPDTDPTGELGRHDLGGLPESPVGSAVDDAARGGELAGAPTPPAPPLLPELPNQGAVAVDDDPTDLFPDPPPGDLQWGDAEADGWGGSGRAAPTDRPELLDPDRSESVPFPNAGRVRPGVDHDGPLGGLRVRAELLWYRSRRSVSTVAALLGLLGIVAIVLYFAAREIRSTTNSVETDVVPQQLTTATSSPDFVATDAPFVTDVPPDHQPTTTTTARTRPREAPSTATTSEGVITGSTVIEVTPPTDPAAPTTGRTATTAEATPPTTTEDRSTARGRGRRTTTTQRASTTGEVLPPPPAGEDASAGPSGPVAPALTTPRVIALASTTATLVYSSDECVATRFRLTGSDGSSQTGTSTDYDASIQCSASWRLDFGGSSGLLPGVAYTLAVSVKNVAGLAAASRVDFTTPA